MLVATSPCGDNMPVKMDTTSKLGLKLAGLKTLLDPRHFMLEQLQPLLTAGGSSLIANAVVALIVLTVMSTPETLQTARIWTACCLVVIAGSAIALAIVRKNFNTKEGLATAFYILTIASAARGFVWGVGFTLLMPKADSYEQIMLGWMIAGLVCGGAFSTWSLPAAAMAFSGLAALGGFLGMSAVPGVGDTWMPYAVPILFIFLMRSVIVNVKVFRQSVAAERQVAAKNEVISLLLRDFEENASDWLWETDGKGNLVRGVERFARILELPAEKINSKSLTMITEIFALSKNDNAVFCEKFKTEDAFSNQIVALSANGMPRFIKISARPFLNQSGSCTGWHGVASDVTDERIADMKVRKLALFDTLTELPNRAFFYDRLDAVLGSRVIGKTWIMYLDLDGFKSVNDTHGHAVGDQLLRVVAARLNSCLPAKGMLARLGGDEFSIVCNGPLELIETYAAKILQSMQQTFVVGSNDIHIGVSIGVTLVLDGIVNRDELMRRADVALYAAKHQGKGVVRYYDEELDRLQLRRRDVEAGLRKALAQGLFKLHYQPIIEVQSGRIHSYEALLRLDTPELGRINPAEFIPIAEESGLIIDIGDWVIRRACMDAMGWPNDICVAVNVSPLQLKSNHILSIVTHALAAASLPASRLELELTESALVENVEHTTRILNDLKSLGVRLALDDFGTGYSSLSHLHQFNFDRIKIDRSFVQSFGSRRESAAVVNAVAQIARDLGILMTAEGVETAEQMTAMESVGCDQVQGFLLGRPEPMPETEGHVVLRRSNALSA
jgi:diguanylate cyclase (GGDEF)-like protein